MNFAVGMDAATENEAVDACLNEILTKKEATTCQKETDPARKVKDRKTERDQAGADPLSIQMNLYAVREKAAGVEPGAVRARAPEKDREKGGAPVDAATRAALRLGFLETNR
jgi:hypothetical protein